MTTSGQLKAKVDRFKNKLAAKGASLDARKKRVLAKKLKRFQRARRTALALEKRAAGKSAEGPAKMSGNAPVGDRPVKEKPIGDQPPKEQGQPTEERV